LSTKVQVILIHNGRAAWTAVAPLDAKHARKMTQEELDFVARKAAEAVAAMVDTEKYEPALTAPRPESSPEVDRKRRR
jgi:hypothetical protein